MFQYERMQSLLPGGSEFVYCPMMTLDNVQQAIAAAYGRHGIPVSFRRDKIKSGILSFDPCLVVYNPQNLDYHVYVFVVRNVNGMMMFSYYSAGSAAGQHIGGGITNMANMGTKLSGMLKSKKQKEAEENAYLGSSCIANDDAMIALGIYRETDFDYRNRRY